MTALRPVANVVARTILRTEPDLDTGEPSPAPAVGRRGADGGTPPAVWLLLAIGAGVRALRFGARFPTPYHWDEAATGVSALHVLAGTYPVNFLGNEYQGAPAAYPLAAWFALVGSSTWALDAFAWATGLLVLWTGWLVARRFVPRDAALAALVILAMPPVPLAARSLSAALDYPVLLALGNVFLLGTHSVLYRAVSRPRALLALGIVAGLGWWTSPLFVVYLAPFVWLALRQGLLWRAPAAWLAGGALLGSLPCWAYEAVYFPSTRYIVHQGGALPPQPLTARTLSILGEHLPALLVPEQAEPGPRIAALVASAAITLLGAGIALRRDRPELRWALGLGGAQGTGGALLWGVAAVNLAIVLASPQGAIGHRYLLPLYSVLPCWAGMALASAWRRRRALGIVAAAVLLVPHAWLNWTQGPGGVPSSQWRWRPIKERLEPLVGWLDARNLRHAYWALRDFPPSYEMTYLARGRIVFADPWRELALPHARVVDGSRRPVFVAIAGSDEAAELRASLPALGLDVRETQVGQYVVIETQIDPGARPAAVGLPPDAWRVSAEPNPDHAGNLVDRDAATGWSTGRGQRPGQRITVDLGREMPVTRVALLSLDWQDTPVGFRIDVSRDGVRWHTAVAVPRYWGPLFVSEHHAMLKVRRGRVEAAFAPVPARFVRIVQTGTAPHRRWSAREVFVSVPGPPPAEGEPALAPLVQSDAVDFVYTSPWLAARLWAELRGQVQAPESNFFVNSNGRPTPSPERLAPFRPGSSRPVLLGRDADVGQVRAMLGGQGAPVREAVAGPYRLLRFPAPDGAPRPIGREAWEARSSANPAEAVRAIDGNRRTGWAGTVGAGEFLAIDLGRLTRVARIRLTPGSAAAGSHDIELDGSDDGVSWRPLGPLMWAGPLYWTGWELLRNSQDRREFTFPPDRVRHLRVRPAAGVPAGKWVVDEIDLFE